MLQGEIVLKLTGNVKDHPAHVWDMDMDRVRVHKKQTRIGKWQVSTCTLKSKREREKR